MTEELTVEWTSISEIAHGMEVASIHNVNVHGLMVQVLTLIDSRRCFLLLAEAIVANACGWNIGA